MNQDKYSSAPSSQINSKQNPTTTSLYRIKRSFRITLDSPPSSLERKSKDNKISVLPLNLEKIHQSKKRIETLPKSPNFKPFWPSTVTKRDEYRIDHFALFQNPLKENLKYEDQLKFTTEHHTHKIGSKKHTKSHLGSLTTSRNDSRIQFVVQSSQPTLPDRQKTQMSDNIFHGISRANKKTLQLSMNEESLSEVRLNSNVFYPSRSVLPTIQSPKILMIENNKIDVQSNKRTLSKINIPIRPTKPLRKENNILSTNRDQLNVKPMLDKRRIILTSTQPYIDSNKISKNE